MKEKEEQITLEDLGRQIKLFEETEGVSMLEYVKKLLIQQCLENEEDIEWVKEYEKMEDTLGEDKVISLEDIKKELI